MVQQLPVADVDTLPATTRPQDRMARVLFVSYSAEWRGPTNSLVHLLRHLRARFDCAVLTPGSGPLTEILGTEGIALHQLPSLRKSAIRGMVRLFRSQSFDLIYANNTSSSSENALIAAKMCRLPFVCHIRGMASGPVWRRRAFLRFADATIAVSSACARASAPYAAPDSLYVVHNGVSVDDWTGDRLAARRRLLDTLRAEDAFIIITIGHVSPRKGYEYAVQMIRQLVEKGVAVHLAIVGRFGHRPQYVEHLRSQICDLGIEDRVHLLGFRDDVPLLVGGADAYLHTAVAEPHPRSVLEAMAAELPVIAFAADGVAESVVHGETGYLTPVGDVDAASAALETVARNAALRQTLGASGKRRVIQCFSSADTARRVGDVIERTLECKRRPWRGAGARGRADS